MFAKTTTAVILALLVLAATAEGGAGNLSFTSDHDAGLKEAKATGRPAFVYFTADW